MSLRATGSQCRWCQFWTLKAGAAWEGAACNRQNCPVAFSLAAGRRFDPNALQAYSLRVLEQFQEKCETVFRPELRQNKEIERFCVSVKR
jgi:tRNA A37 threonylcarbamoyladenosine dehydratase